MVPILTTLCLLLLAAFCAIAADAQTILDYKILPACARSCEILQISEKNCLPPQAPKTRDTIYIDCLCHSEYLRELHEDGEICHGSCSQRDDIVIHSYFNGLCGTKPSESGHNHSPSKTAAIIVSSESSSPRRLSETSTANGVASTERVEPPPHNQTAAVEEATWLDRHRIAFIIAISVVFTTLILLIVSAVLFHRRRRVTRQNQDNNIIPLETFTLRVDQLPDPIELENRSRTAASSSNNLHNQTGTVPASPLDLSGSSYGFVESLRFYEEEIRERDAAQARRWNTRPRPGTPRAMP